MPIDDSYSELREQHPDARLLPTAHEKQGGASRLWSVLLALLSIGGIFASAMLYSQELQKTANPIYQPNCDINPLIGCSSSLLSWQAHLLFGLSNAIVGIVAFSILLIIAVVLFFRVKLPRLLWWLMALGGLGGLVFVAFFVTESLRVFGTLCPYCMVIWTCTIPIAIMLISQALKLGLSPDKPIPTWRRVIIRERVLITIAIYVVIILVIVVGLRDTIAMVL